MPRVTVTELAATLEQLQAQMAEISHRIQSLERENAGMHGPNGAASVPLHPSSVGGWMERAAQKTLIRGRRAGAAVPLHPSGQCASPMPKACGRHYPWR